MPPRDETDDGRASWPYSSLLCFGYFGADTPTGRRVRDRTMVGLIAFVVANLLAGNPRVLPVARALPAEW